MTRSVIVNQRDRKRKRTMTMTVTSIISQISKIEYWWRQRWPKLTRVLLAKNIFVFRSSQRQGSNHSWLQVTWGSFHPWNELRNGVWLSYSSHLQLGLWMDPSNVRVLPAQPHMQSLSPVSHQWLNESHKMTHSHLSLIHGNIITHNIVVGDVGGLQGTTIPPVPPSSPQWLPNSPSIQPTQTHTCLTQK